MNHITFVFRSAPHGTSSGREGVDAILACSAYCDNLTVIFMEEGVGHLIPDQNTGGILSKNYAPMFKLFDLYEIESIYVCRDSLVNLGLDHVPLLLDAKWCDRRDIATLIQSSNKVMTF